MPVLVDVYPYQFSANLPEFLILKRADDQLYAGQWRMVAGKVKEAEAVWQSGLRELREETGLFPSMYWAVPSINQFYEPNTDTIHHIPVFAAQIEKHKSIVLNKEHSDYKWIKASEAISLIHWPEQRRLISLINNILTTQNLLKEWKIGL